MRIGVHFKQDPWTRHWVDYCAERRIACERLNCYSPDIIERLRGIDGLLWHFDHWLGADLLAARHILTSAEAMGLSVFPDRNTCWHFDDKIAQKYLLEALNAPLAPTHVFYDRNSAAEWLRSADFPLVAKLRRGAGSYNVRLLRTRSDAESYCRRLFGRGAHAVPDVLEDISTKLSLVHSLGDFARGLRRLPGFFRAVRHGKKTIPREKGYVLFQKFIAGNAYDTRIAVVGNRAWGFTRNVRKGDFRASGSGSIDYDLSRINPRCVQTAFDVVGAIGAQSLAFDFVQDADGRPLILEISYGYQGDAVYRCEGHWDRRMNFHQGHTWPELAIMEDLLDEIRRKQARRPL